ncbi:MAG: hypothetical protein U5L03_04710 [Burkholderiaceae bacterium]|nr:hypothetical protein [Burkholderiaceae bacterium]
MTTPTPIAATLPSHCLMSFSALRHAAVGAEPAHVQFFAEELGRELEVLLARAKADADHVFHGFPVTNGCLLSRLGRRPPGPCRVSMRRTVDVALSSASATRSQPQ